jgi:hypothetical protein
MPRNLRTVLLIVLLFFNISVVFSQPCQGPECGEDPDAVPISGIEWLLLGGATLGATRLFRNKKK